MNRTGNGTNRTDQRSRLEAELAHLESSERPRLLAGLGATDGKDVADQADRHVRELELAQVNLRIDRLRDRLSAMDEVPRSSGGALGVGTVVVVDLGDGPETYLLARFPDGELPTITLDSPLGRALSNARPGQTVRFRAPRGESSVTLISIGEPDQAVA